MASRGGSGVKNAVLGMDCSEDIHALPALQKTLTNALQMRLGYSLDVPS